VRPEETLSFAKRLFDDHGDSECMFRAVAHAAYYAVYHLVCDQLGLDPWRNYSQCAHDTIRLRVKNLDPGKAAPLLREARRSFDTLWQLRRRADYDFDNTFTLIDAERALERAEAVFSRGGITVCAEIVAPAAIATERNHDIT
jgi:uncharacterized protein (UPF0332 family)